MSLGRTRSLQQYFTRLGRAERRGEGRGARSPFVQIYQPSHCHPHQISCAKKDGAAHCTTASERDSRAEGEGAVPRREAAKKHNDAKQSHQVETQLWREQCWDGSGFAAPCLLYRCKVISNDHTLTHYILYWIFKSLSFFSVNKFFSLFSEYKCKLHVWTWSKLRIG